MIYSAFSTYIFALGYIMNFSSCQNYWGGGQTICLPPPPIFSLGGDCPCPPPPPQDRRLCPCTLTNIVQSSQTILHGQTKICMRRSPKLSNRNSAWKLDYCMRTVNNLGKLTSAAAKLHASHAPHGISMYPYRTRMPPYPYPPVP